MYQALSTKRQKPAWTVLLVTSLAAACGANTLANGTDGFSEEEWKLVQELEPLREPPPAATHNKFAENEAAAKLGQKLFWDTEFATAIKVEGPSGKVGETGKVSCGTCHDPAAYFADPRPSEGTSHGTGYTSRNTPALVNIAYYEWFNWDGRRDSLAAQAGGSPETGTNAASNRLMFAHIVYAKYKEEYESLFGPLDPALDPDHPDADRFPPNGKPKSSPDDPDGPWELMDEADREIITRIMANSGKAIEAYERRLISDNSPFKRYLKDQDTEAFSGAAKRGLKVFIGKGACNECHRGPIMTDNKFHNIGVPQAGGLYVPSVDDGRFTGIPRLLRNVYRTSGPYSDDPAAGERKLAEANRLNESEEAREHTLGQFRTPGLLNVAETGPYFHNGSAKTLRQVVEHYNRGGGEPGSFSGTLDPKIRPLQLTEQEISDLVAFLESLTGDPVPEEWARNPLE